MSLARPHAIWWTAGANPYEVSKAVIQCRMLSGRYRTRLLTGKWSESGNRCCPAPSCPQVEESLEHILLECPAYTQTRNNLEQKFKAAKTEELRKLAIFALQQPQAFLMQFLLDATGLAITHTLVSKLGEDVLFPLFNLTRTWCYAVHRERLNLLRLEKTKQ